MLLLVKDIIKKKIRTQDLVKKGSFFIQNLKFEYFFIKKIIKKKEEKIKISEKGIKIFVTGFFNSGKSTLVHTLDEKAIHVEKKLSKAYNEEKTSTTTGFDLGRLVWARPNLNYETEGVIMSKTEYLREKDEYSGWHIKYIELKGSPGQTQFSAVRKILATGSDGVIFLID